MNTETSSPQHVAADLLIIAAILIFSAVYCLLALNLSVHPFEDAAILMRYAVNIAHGNGIVWNAGEQPVDGGTDFLFMCSSAALHATGLSIEFSVRLLSTLSHGLTLVIVYLILRFLQGSGKWAAGAASLFLAVGPGLYYIASYFGTSFFGLWVAINWFGALRILKDKHQSRHDAIIFSVSSLLLGLARPEGAILALLVFAAVLAGKGSKATKEVSRYFIIVFGGIGSLYFLWRWNYFGYPLPNPFYKKGGGTLHWDSLLNSVVNVIKLTFPFIAPLAVIGVQKIAEMLLPKKYSPIGWRIERAAFAPLIPIAGFTAIWILLSNEMNYFMRFQYPVLIIVLMSWYPLCRTIADQSTISLSRSQKNILGIAFLLLIAAYQILLQTGTKLLKEDGRYTVAMILSEYKNEGYTLATSEAGLLPLYSGWRTVDTWGLNDQWIAHNGTISREYLAQQSPEVIMVLAYYSPIAEGYEPIPFVEHIKVIREYAETNNYELAASFGISPFSSHCYYVKRNFKHRDDIVRKIAQAEYHWFTTGEKCINFVNYTEKQ